MHVCSYPIKCHTWGLGSVWCRVCESRLYGNCHDFKCFNDLNSNKYCTEEISYTPKLTPPPSKKNKTITKARFQPNLAQCILGWRQFKFVLITDYTLSQGEIITNKIVRMQWLHLIIFSSITAPIFIKPGTKCLCAMGTHFYK